MVQIIVALIMGCLLPLTSAYADSGPLAGYWKHAEQPVWIQVDPEAGTGQIIRNDADPERVGSDLLRAIEGGTSSWRGQIYAPAKNEYKDATLTVDAEGQLVVTIKVGFISRTVLWLPVERVPD